MNIPIEEIESKLLEKKIDAIKVQEILRELEEVAIELKEEKKSEKIASQKWENIIIILDKNGDLKDKELVGWVVNQYEGDDAGTILSRLGDAAKAQNEAAKRKKNRIDDLVSLFECLKSKFTKEKHVRIKTKELTRVLVTDGKIV